MMIEQNDLTSILFFDLETSSEYSSYEELEEHNPRKALLWKEKTEKTFAKDKSSEWENCSESYTRFTPLNAEFGKIVCGSFCYLTEDNDTLKANMKSFYDDGIKTEKEILVGISTLLSNIERAGRSMKLSGHYIKNFDIPWLVKRMIINRVEIPPQLRTWNKKPWEITHIDTAELWNIGVWGNHTSLDLLACSLEIQSPKENMKGAYVGQSYWIDKEYDKIAEYCEADVKCGVRICHRLSSSIKELVF